MPLFLYFCQLTLPLRILLLVDNVCKLTMTEFYLRCKGKIVTLRPRVKKWKKYVLIQLLKFFLNNWVVLPNQKESGSFHVSKGKWFKRNLAKKNRGNLAQTYFVLKADIFLISRLHQQNFERQKDRFVMRVFMDMKCERYFQPNIINAKIRKILEKGAAESFGCLV